jgi:hypothetical protein
MTCDSKTAGGMLDTITALQKDPHFANPFPHNETSDPTTGFTFAVGVDFKPTVARMAEK